MGPAILAGIGALAGSALNGIVGYHQSRGLMNYQYKLNRAMIEDERAYNDPIAQMSRLRNAGLNPNLVYNGGNVPGNQTQAGHVNPVNRDAGIDLGVNTAVQTYLQKKGLEQSIAESKSRQAKMLSETIGQFLKNRYTRKTMQTSIEQTKANLEHTLQSIAESRQRVDESSQRVSLMKSQANEVEEQIKLIQAKEGLTRQQIVTEKLQPDLVRAKIRQLMESATTTAKQREVMESIIRLNDAKIQELEYQGLYLTELALKTHEEGKFQHEVNKMNIGGITGKNVWELLSKILIIMLKGD